MATNRNVVYIYGDYNLDALELCTRLMTVQANEDGEAEYLTCGRMKNNTTWPEETEKPVFSIVESNYFEFASVPQVPDWDQFTPWFIYVYYPAKYFLSYEIEDILRRNGRNVKESDVKEALERSRAIEQVPINDITSRWFSPEYESCIEADMPLTERSRRIAQEIEEELGINYENFLVMPARSLTPIMRAACARHFLGMK